MSFIRILLPLALIALCLAFAGGRGLWDRFADLSLPWMGAAVAMLNLVIILSALRWRLTATALGLPLTVGGAVREYYLAQFVNQTLPGGVLGDAARAVRSRNGGPLTPAAQAVVLERASGQIGMAAILGLATIGAAVRPGTLPPVDAIAIAPVWMALAITVFLAFALVALGISRRTTGSWGNAVRIALARRWRMQLTLSVTIAALTVTAFALAARATGTALPIFATALVAPLVLTAMLLPASVAGWGWREGAAAVLFPLAGADAAAGFAASIAFGIAVLASTLPGALFFLRRKRARPACVDCTRN